MKWAVITGSSSGLGLAMAVHLLEQGWHVAGGSRSGTAIEHDNFYDLELDVTDEAAVEEFYRTLSELTGEVHLFVQNAGVCELSPAEDTSLESFSAHLNTNATGAFLMLRGLRPFLVPQQTHIVSLLSMAALYAYPGMVAYGASKHAQKAVLETFQKEWKALKLRFTPLSSGAIDTPLWDGVAAGQSADRMLSLDDFLHVFDFVVNAPANLKFAELTFLHREGFLE
jgi:NAD(P)-dependent dehydrogenase (short-subunit alcohol dehydrogenase family)